MAAKIDRTSSVDSKKFCYLLAFVMVFFVPFFLYSQDNYPGASVIEQEISNINEITIKLQCMKEKDPETIDSILTYLKSSLISLEYLQNILKHSAKKRSNDRHEGSFHAEVKCKRCGGTGDNHLPDDKVIPCKSCGGDGWVWTPSATSNEKTCGKCKGSGTIDGQGANQSCNRCNGTGLAHSRPNPPDGWWENK